MKAYKFTGITSESNSLNYIKLTKETEERINSDPEIIEQAKKVNKEYFQKLQEIVKDSENAERAGILVDKLNHSAARFQYIKNIGEYEAEIDLLTWEFTLL